MFDRQRSSRRRWVCIWPFWRRLCTFPWENASSQNATSREACSIIMAGVDPSHYLTPVSSSLNNDGRISIPSEINVLPVTCPLLLLSKG